jgi:hypothetical protein
VSGTRRDLMGIFEILTFVVINLETLPSCPVVVFTTKILAEY